MGNVSLLTFVLAALVVLLIPGPGVLYAVTRSLTQGFRAGLISVLGLSTGALVQVAAATAGLAAISLASAIAFGIVKFLGALYLIYLGLRALMFQPRYAETSAPKPDTLYRIFADGMVVSVLNPKIAVFFLVFLPQFIAPEQGAIQYQFMLLGLIYVLLAICTDSAYALFAGSLRQFLSKRLLLGPLPRFTSGFIYLGLGVGLALTERKAW